MYKNHAKKLLGLILAAAMLCLPGVTAFADKEADEIISQNDISSIMQTYSDEFSIISEERGSPVTTIDGATMPIIKSCAVKYYLDEDLDFVGLMDSITLAGELYKKNASWEPSALGVSILNEKTTIVRSFGAVKGEYVAEVPKYSTTNSATTITAAGNIGVSAGEIVKGFGIDANLSVSSGYAIQGPVNNETLVNGKVATHNVFFSVLYGTIVRYECDMVDALNGIWQHYTMYKVSEPTAYSRCYDAKAFLTDVSYIDNQSKTDSLIFGNFNDLKANLRSNPEQFLA